MADVLSIAFDAGYRMIDTAASYSNEISLGKALQKLSVRRDELFIQDKLWITNRGYHEAQKACKKSLHKLKLDYLDAYLVHWPASPILHQNWEEVNAETWAGLEALQKDGVARYIGVSNFKPYHIETLMKSASVVPQINQIELHPGFAQEQTVVFCREHGIHVEAHSPLGNGQLMDNSLLKDIAATKGKTAAQVCLRWALDKGVTVIPKSANPERIRENIDIFDFSLSKEETNTIDKLPFCGGIGLDSDEVVDFDKLQ